MSELREAIEQYASSQIADKTRSIRELIDMIDERERERHDITLDQALEAVNVNDVADFPGAEPYLLLLILGTRYQFASAREALASLHDRFPNHYQDPRPILGDPAGSRLLRTDGQEWAKFDELDEDLPDAAAPDFSPWDQPGRRDQPPRDFAGRFEDEATNPNFSAPFNARASACGPIPDSEIGEEDTASDADDLPPPVARARRLPPDTRPTDAMGTPPRPASAPAAALGARHPESAAIDWLDGHGDREGSPAEQLWSRVRSLFNPEELAQIFGILEISDWNDFVENGKFASFEAFCNTYERDVGHFSDRTELVRQMIHDLGTGMLQDSYRPEAPRTVAGEELPPVPVAPDRWLGSGPAAGADSQPVPVAASVAGAAPAPAGLPAFLRDHANEKGSEAERVAFWLCNTPLKNTNDKVYLTEAQAVQILKAFDVQEWEDFTRPKGLITIAAQIRQIVEDIQRCSTRQDTASILSNRLPRGFKISRAPRSSTTEGVAGEMPAQAPAVAPSPAQDRLPAFLGENANKNGTPAQQVADVLSRAPLSNQDGVVYLTVTQVGEILRAFGVTQFADFSNLHDGSHTIAGKIAGMLRSIDHYKGPVETATILERLPTPAAVPPPPPDASQPVPVAASAVRSPVAPVKPAADPAPAPALRTPLKRHTTPLEQDPRLPACPVFDDGPEVYLPPEATKLIFKFTVEPNAVSVILIYSDSPGDGEYPILPDDPRIDSGIYVKFMRKEIKSPHPFSITVITKNSRGERSNRGVLYVTRTPPEGRGATLEPPAPKPATAPTPPPQAAAPAASVEPMRRAPQKPEPVSSVIELEPDAKELNYGVHFPDPDTTQISLKYSFLAEAEIQPWSEQLGRPPAGAGFRKKVPDLSRYPVFTIAVQAGNAAGEFSDPAVITVRVKQREAATPTPSATAPTPPPQAAAPAQPVEPAAAQKQRATPPPPPLPDADCILPGTPEGDVLQAAAAVVRASAQEYGRASDADEPAHPAAVVSARQEAAAEAPEVPYPRWLTMKAKADGDKYQHLAIHLTSATTKIFTPKELDKIFGAVNVTDWSSFKKAHKRLYELCEFFELWEKHWRDNLEELKAKLIADFKNNALKTAYPRPKPNSSPEPARRLPEVASERTEPRFRPTTRRLSGAAVATGMNYLHKEHGDATNRVGVTGVGVPAGNGLDFPENTIIPRDDEIEVVADAAVAAAAGYNTEMLIKNVAVQGDEKVVMAIPAHPTPPAGMPATHGGMDRAAEVRARAEAALEGAAASGGPAKKRHDETLVVRARQKPARPRDSAQPGTRASEAPEGKTKE